jgi:uncharacterized membrane protein
MFFSVTARAHDKNKKQYLSRHLHIRARQNTRMKTQIHKILRVNVAYITVAECFFLFYFFLHRVNVTYISVAEAELASGHAPLYGAT